ncbi:MAG TPA: adenylyl-sulfate kinase [Acidimicrobiales bacterium]|nr:adenylyl-sulfate kinase [Acidimicrobiales bacterium]
MANARAAGAGICGATIWLTGLPASGKSTIASEAERRLLERGVATIVLDGDDLRHGLNRDLGFSPGDRRENVRRITEVARLFARAGIVALVPVISPYAAGRARSRAVHDDAGLAFAEVFVRTPLAECERRDPKGLYARARRGEVADFTGVHDPYEVPERPDLEVATMELSVGEAGELVVELVADLTGRQLTAAGWDDHS